MKVAILQSLVVDQYLDHFKAKKILDAGCGQGNFEYLIKQRKIPCEIIGIDTNKEALKKAEKNLPKFKFLEASLLKKLPFKKQEFDTIVMFDVIEHLPKGSEVKVLKRLNQILKKNGSLIMSTMHHTPLNFLDPAWYFGHRHYSQNKLASIATQSGLVIKEINLIGDFWWELDTLFLYLCQSLFKKEYTNQLRKRFSTTNQFKKKGPRLCLRMKKIN